MAWYPFDLIQKKATVAGLPCLIIGGHAVNWFVEPRATLDVDFLSTFVAAPEWKQLLADEGFKLKRDQGNFLQFSPPYGIPWRLDVMLVNDNTFAKLAAKALDAVCFGVSTKVPSPEHLIALKLHAMVHGPVERYEKDIGDILGISRCCQLDPNGEILTEIFERYGTPEIYREYKRRLGKTR